MKNKRTIFLKKISKNEECTKIKRFMIAKENISKFRKVVKCNKKNIKIKKDYKYDKLIAKERIIKKIQKDEMAEETLEQNEEQQEDKYLEIPTRWIKIKGWTKNLFEKWFVEEVDEEELKAKKEKKSKKSSKKNSIFTRLKKAYNAFMEKEENDK